MGDCVSELIETDVQKPLKLGLKIKIELQKKILKVIYLLSKVSSLSHNHAESIILSLFKLMGLAASKNLSGHLGFIPHVVSKWQYIKDKI